MFSTMKTTTSLLIVLTILTTGLTAVLRAQPAPTSPSELLEKGIYNEETKGDLDSAIAIYQQLVAESDINRSLAAEAEFRLGQCLFKKNRTAEATAAFEKLIHEFPNETNLVAKAREYLPSGLKLGPVPWVDGERLQLNIALAAGTDIGMCEYRADSVQQANGHKMWRVGARLSAGTESVSSVDVDAETFRPLTSRWKHSLLGEVTATYKSNEVDVLRVGKTQPVVTPMDSDVYDNEEAMHAMRRLPFQVGYKATMRVFSTLGSTTVISIGLEVVGKETVEVPSGKFDCFKVHLSLVNQDFWFSTDAHHYLVKFEAGPIVAQLTSISQCRPGETVSFVDKELGISFTAPPDWVVWRAMNGQPAKQELIRTFDPEADAVDGGMRLFATDSLSEAAQKSPRVWADEQLAKNKDLKVRPGSWKVYSVGGRPGAGCITEYSVKGKTHVQFLLYVLGKKNSELFVITSAAEKFDALKAQFETIIASYRAE